MPVVYLPTGTPVLLSGTHIVLGFRFKAGRQTDIRIYATVVEDGARFLVEKVLFRRIQQDGTYPDFGVGDPNWLLGSHFAPIEHPVDAHNMTWRAIAEYSYWNYLNELGVNLD